MSLPSAERRLALFLAGLIALAVILGLAFGETLFSGPQFSQAFLDPASGPAEVLGMGERFGSLRAGRAGDMVIWDGDPLEASSGVVSVFIDGVEQPLSNHQTKLRDRYRTPQDGALPKAYDW